MYRRNFARVGRNAAGAAGVWGLLLRTEKRKHLAFEASALRFRLHDGDPEIAGLHRVSARCT